MSAALKIVKNHLAVGVADQPQRDRFICIAAMYARRLGEITPEVEKRVQALIRQRLDGHSSVESWVKAKVMSGADKEWFLRLPYSQQCVQFQKFRHRWLDALIAEYAAKEQKRKLSDALKIVKKHLAVSVVDQPQREQYICIAAIRARIAGEITAGMEQKVRALIQQHIGTHASVESWVRETIMGKADNRQFYKLPYSQRCVQFQKYRHRWLDHLIAVQVAKGN